MADTEAPAAQDQQNGRRGVDLKSLMFYAILGFTIMNAFGAIQPKVERGATTSVHAKVASESGVAAANGEKATAARRHFVPLAHRGDLLSIRVTVDEDLFPPVEFSNLVFDHDHLKASIGQSVSMDMTSCVAKNCSANVHVSWTLRGKTFSDSTPLIRFCGTKAVEKHHLIGGDKEKHGELPEGTAKSGEVVYRAYLLPSLTLSPVVDFSSPLPPQIEAFAPLDNERMVYGPIVYINDFWIIREHMHVLNSTTATTHPFQLNVTIAPLSLWKFLMYKQFDATMRSQADLGLSAEDTADETKRIFLDTNPYFLALTGLVTLLHMLFEYLAFANDIKFWRGRKDFKGLSLRSVAINCYFQTIVFLYLVDSNEASWTILLPSGFGVLAEYWKLTQCVVVSKKTTEETSAGTVDDEEKRSRHGEEGKAVAFSLLGYNIHFSDSYDKRTRRHDDTAVRWLMYVMIPVLIGYSIYSAVYNEHKSWYSYVIHTQVQFIYFFGFAMMTPQIFINYKLKSVGQIPWRTFVYKALNTVIDDLFAFIIKMPWLHRIACFRDDVVFVILLYQRWIYPVDMTRMEDDGEGGGAVEDEAEGDAKTAKTGDTTQGAEEGVESASTKKNQ